MKPEWLSSNRVNFLIWRYLIEGNYRETAVKFQKEWHMEAPHRQLDFAPHVPSHALVATLCRGLQYEALEREYAQSQSPHQTAAEGVFGPLGTEQPAPAAAAEEEHDTEMDAEGEPDIEVENPRKRPLDRAQQPLHNGSPAKRARLSNGGFENGVEPAATGSVDNESHHGDAYPSPLEREQQQTPIARTEEHGTQCDAADSLNAEFIDLSTDEAALADSDTSPVLLHCAWSPTDPGLLAAGGSDALARIWTTPKLPGPDPAANHVNGLGVPPFHTLTADGTSPKSTVTQMAWNWDGSLIAVASDSRENSKARISLWAADGSHYQNIEVPESPVFKLRWAPDRNVILAIAPDNGGALVTVYDFGDSTSKSHVLSNHDLDSEPLDAAWIRENEFLLCGGELLMSLRCTDDGNIVVCNKYETREGDGLTQVKHDARSALTATCSEKGHVDVWDLSGKRREIKAHDGAVTALAWQPLKSDPLDGERLLASGGEDGAIFIWNARSTDGKAICSMTMELPIVALAFTPNGDYIAGATSEKILIWLVADRSSVPRASWSRVPHPGWRSPRMTDSDVEDEHSLCWDSTGQKLAYGVNSRLAIITFR